MEISFQIITKIYFMKHLFLLISTILFYQFSIAQTQIGNDILGDGDDEFGFSISLSNDGTRMAVGAPKGTDYTNIYEWNGSSWVRIGQEIHGENQGDKSGTCVSISGDGNRVAIGAPGNDSNGNSSGHVRIFQWNGSSWTKIGSDIDGEATNDGSGRSVALSDDGNRVVIGSQYSDNGFDTDAGQIRSYEWNGSNWIKMGNDIHGGASNDQFGYDVAISADGTYIAASSTNNSLSAGQTRIFEWTGSTWVQVGASLVGDNSYDYAGRSIALSDDGTTIAIGANGSDIPASSAGSVKVYEWNSTAWLQKGTNITGSALSEQAGYTTEISDDGNTVLVGARGHSGYTGKATTYEYNGTDWVQKGDPIEGISGSDQYSIGLSIAGNGASIAAASPYANSNEGYVQVFGFCSAPNNVIVDLGDNPNQVLLTWDEVSGAIKYQVRYRRALTSSWTNVIATSPSKIITGLVQNKVYDYRVRTQCPDGSWSNMTAIEKFRTVPCTAPINITTTQLNNNKVRVEWDDYNHADKYQLFYRIAGTSGDYLKRVTYNPGQTALTLNGLTPGGTYEFKIRSFCEVSYGPFTEDDTFTNSANREINVDFEINSIFPNPAKDQIQFTITVAQKNEISISILDILGQEVSIQNKSLDKGIFQEEININHLSNGTYFLRISDQENISIQKFIKS